MKALILSFLVILIFTSCSSHGEKRTSEYQPQHTTRSLTEDNDMVEVRVIKTYAVSKSSMKIKGLCYVESHSDRQPCEDITLQLMGHDSKLETMTDEIGSFSFMPLDREPKSIEVASSRYKLKAGKVSAQAGSILTVILIRK